MIVALSYFTASAARVGRIIRRGCRHDGPRHVTLCGCKIPLTSGPVHAVLRAPATGGIAVAFAPNPVRPPSAGDALFGGDLRISAVDQQSAFLTSLDCAARRMRSPRHPPAPDCAGGPDRGLPSRALGSLFHVRGATSQIEPVTFSCVVIGFRAVLPQPTQCPQRRRAARPSMVARFGSAPRSRKNLPGSKLALLIAITGAHFSPPLTVHFGAACRADIGNGVAHQAEARSCRPRWLRKPRTPPVLRPPRRHRSAAPSGSCRKRLPSSSTRTLQFDRLGLNARIGSSGQHLRTSTRSCGTRHQSCLPVAGLGGVHVRAKCRNAFEPYGVAGGGRDISSWFRPLWRVALLAVSSDSVMRVSISAAQEGVMPLHARRGLYVRAAAISRLASCKSFLDAARWSGVVLSYARRNVASQIKTAN